MQNESDLMPYEAEEIPAGPWLVFAPHPDDESFGMGGTLIRARRAGVPVDIVFVTDGSKGGLEDGSIAIEEVRRAEAAAACRYLGVRDHYFWREPDRELRYDDRLIRKVAALAREAAPACVFVPSCLELHPDHRIVAHIVWDGLQKAEGFAGEVLAYDICTQGPVNRLIDITEVMPEKRELMELYKSQIKDGKYMEVVEGLDRARSFTLPPDCRAAEGFYWYEFSPTLRLEHAVLPWLQKYLQKPEWYAAPLVSVIVRTRNRKQYLIEALSSILVQDYPRIELVVVNDAGEDVSDIVEEFGRSMESRQYVHLTESKGRAAAANAGLERITGDYFLFLDDDDWLDAPHVSNLVRAIRSDPCALVAYTGVRTIGIDKSDFREFNSPFDRNRMYYENYIPIHAALVSRSVVDAGVRFDESLDVFEDWDFWLQIMQRTIAFMHIDGVTANYRIGHDGGVGVRGGHDENKRLIYARWSKTWGLDEIEDLMTRLTVLSHKNRS